MVELKSVFYPQYLVQEVHQNTRQFEWAAEKRLIHLAHIDINGFFKCVIL